MKKIKLILLALILTNAKFYAQVPSYVPSNGLVGWWPFNGNANDASINAIHGTNYGASLTSDRNGNLNSAYQFSGAQWIQCGYNPILNVGTGSFTLSCWATKEGGNTFQHFITRNEISAWPNATTSYALRYQGPGVGIYASGNASSSNGAIATGSLSNLQNWNHFVGVYNATSGIISVYVNGVLSISSPISANPQSYNNNGGLFFGVEHPTVALPSGPQFLSGKLDDIGIWNRALTQSEITALYTNTPPPTFSIQASGCPNVSYQPTNFTPNAGSSYQWTITPSAGSQNSTGLNTANPTFIFNSGGTYSITVQETINGNTLTSAPVSISILNLTNITPSVDGTSMQVINGVNTFSICTGLNTTSATVYNDNWVNPPNTTYSYTINNGAQTPITTSATVPITYGNNTFTLTATSGVCALTNTINIYSGANPYVALGANNTISLCPGSTVNFVIDPTQSVGVNNSPGTTYSLIFSDNPTAPVNMSNLVNDTIIPHQYNVTSCGMTYPGNLYPANTFYAQVIAQNYCGQTMSVVSPITVHNPTTANFTVSDSTICAGESITLTNIGLTGSIVGMNAPYNCNSQGKFYWSISGGTSGVNYTLISGVLGFWNSIYNNPNGSTNTVGMGSNSLNIQFLIPGIYTITQHYSNSCGTKTFVRNIQVGGIIAGANQSVCLGNSVTLTASGGSNYTWSGGIQNGVPFTPTSTQIYTVTGTATGGCPNTSSTTVTVNPVPSANAGNDFTITCSLNPTGSTIGMASAVGNSYSWTPTAGLSSASVANPTANPSSSTTYTLSVTNANGCTANDQVVVTVNNTPPTITTPPISSQSICVGGAASTLNVVVSGGTGVPTYQWFTVNGSTSTPIPGATNSSYTPPVFTAAGTFNYTVMVSQATNGCNTTSPNAQVIVVPDPVLTAPMSANYCQDVGVVNALNISALGGINTSYIYQWYVNTVSNNTTGTAIPNATSATYFPPVSAIGTKYYYCVVNNAPISTGCITTTSLATVTVTQGPSISTQPTNQTICIGGSFNSLNVAVAGGSGTPTYQWYANNINSTIGGVLISGATSSSYTPPSNLLGTVYYFCVISFSGSGGCPNISSNVATITVIPPPTISTQPLSSQSICVGGIASTLTVAVSGGTGTPTYQWYTVSGSTSTPIPGATNSSYTPPVFTAAGTFNYTVMVSQATNGCNTTSQNAEIIVIGDPIVSTPLSGIYCQNGTISPLNVTVSGGINTSYSYQWYVNTNNSNVGGTIIAGANSSTYTPPTSMIGTYFYYCIVTNNPTSTGCSTSSPIAQIVIVSSPAFISQPQSNQSTCLGGILNALNVAYTGGTGTATFQWYSNTTNLNSGGTAIPGATSATYLPQSNSAGTVYYYCVISFFSMGSCQAITSNISTVTVLSSITVNPVLDQTICAGTQTSPINFTGTPGATYSWTNSNTSIGLASGGNGNIPSFNAQNNTSTTITATIVITPTITTGNQTCVGTPEIFTITVHPIPVLVSNNDITICCQANPTLMLIANLPCSFNWTASSSSPLMTGFPSGINNSNFISFTPINNSNVTGTIIISIEPTSLQGCVGQVQTININVLPCNVSINQISNTNLCNDAVFNGITFTGTATQVQWINSNPNNGLQFSGMGNIPSIPIVNNGLNAILSQITVYPEYTWNSMSCIGTSMTFEFNIYPTPAVNAGTDQNICVGDLVTLTGSGANTYVWNNGVDNGVPFAPINSTSYIVIGTDVNGCVNSDTIQINVNTPSSSTVNINSCDSYTLNGQTYNSGGIYTQVIPNAAGCDSTITLDLTLNYSPSTPIVTIQNEVNLSTSNNTGVTYQWIQCSDLTDIAGQTNSSFNPAVNGLYAVVAANSCGSDTSDCAEVSTIGLNDMDPNVVLVYPNPNNGEFTIEVPQEMIGMTYQLFDLNGRILKTGEIHTHIQAIHTGEIARGAYWLQIGSQKPIQIVKN